MNPKTAAKAACELLGVSLPTPMPHKSRGEQQVALDTWKRNVLDPAWKATAKRKHPDKGGSNADFIAANDAYKLLMGIKLKPPEPEPEPDWSFDDSDFRAMQDEIREAIQRDMRAAAQEAIGFGAILRGIIGDIVREEKEALQRDITRAAHSKIRHLRQEVTGTGTRRKPKVSTVG